MFRPPGVGARSSLLYSPAQDEGHIKWPSLRAELAMNFVPRRPGGRPFIDGRPNKLIIPSLMCPEWDGLSGWAGFRKTRPGFYLWNGMRFPIEASTGKPVPESRLKPGRTFPMNHQRKIHPRICLKSGTHFPVEASSGNHIPESAPKVGHAFRTGYQPEIVSHSRHEFRDTFSANKEGHITWPSTYICSAGAPMTSRASTPRRLPGDAECEVHREFRTSRRALNVLSVRAGLSEQGTSHSAPPGRRTS